MSDCNSTATLAPRKARRESIRDSMAALASRIGLITACPHNGVRRMGEALSASLAKCQATLLDTSISTDSEAFDTALNSLRYVSLHATDLIRCCKLDPQAAS